ncbi:MAG TPA: hypothetical protein VGB82_13900 [Alphaproteobacteria bacterium]
MDELRVLLAATHAEGRSIVDRLERGVVYTVVFGVMAFACAFTIVAFLGIAVYAAALPDYGPIGAACFAALGAAVLMVVLLLTMRWLMAARSAPPRAQPREAAMAGFPNAAQFQQPKTVWDLVMLVAAGVIAGLAQKQR